MEHLDERTIALRAKGLEAEHFDDYAEPASVQHGTAVVPPLPRVSNAHAGPAVSVTTSAKTAPSRAKPTAKR